MSKRVLYSLLLLIFFSSQSMAQYTSPTLSIPHKIKVSSPDMVHQHIVEKGQTIYSISRAYGISISDLLKVNNKTSTALRLGENIAIPLATSRISTSVTKREKSIPIVYSVRPKDNIYRISKTFFNQPKDALLLRNKLTTNTLNIGQELILGWLQLGKDTQTEVIPTTTIDTYSNKQITITNESVDSLLSKPRKRDYNILLIDEEQYSEDMLLVSEKEVAYWDKTLPNNGKVYVLHNTAVFGSHVEIYNALLKRSIRAKVIGKIPFGAYTDDVKLILSPQAAHQLGGLDERFKVEIQYYTK